MLVRRTPAARPVPIARCGRPGPGRAILRRGTTTGWSAFRYPAAGYRTVDSLPTSCGVLGGCAGRRCAQQRCARRDRPGGGSRCQTHAQPVRSARDRRTGPVGDGERFSSRELRAPYARHTDQLGPGHRLSEGRNTAGSGRTTRSGRPAGAGDQAGTDRADRLDRSARRIALPDARRVAPEPGGDTFDTGGALTAVASFPFQTESGGVL